MIDFQSSSKKYPKDKNLYAAENVNLIPESKFPTIYGKFLQRNFDDDFDLNLKKIRTDNPPRSQTILAKYWLPHDGREILQDPVNNLSDGHKIHPIEVVIERSVMEEIVELGRSVCPDASIGDVREVMGFLAGRLKKDKSGRVWSHVTKSFHSPIVDGLPDRVVLPAEQSGRWLTEIREAGLTYLGLWHTHPTYTPFQSDARLWNWGEDIDMDVQTLKKRCHAWYHCSLVVDPYAGGKNVGNDNMAMSGCYKAVNPGAPISNNNSATGLEMGWRSVTHMIKG